MRHFLTPSLYRRVLLSVLCLAFLCLTNAFPATISHAHAAAISASPLVAVAEDETTPACYFKKATSQAVLRTAPRHPCPAGTEIGIKYVPLHEALALHEAYVLLPSQHASSIAWKQAYVQVEKLINSKTEALQPRVVPNSTSACGTTNYLYGWDYRYNSEVEFEITYHVSSTCNSVTLETANMTGIRIGNVLYLYQLDYAGWHLRLGPPDCRPVTNNDTSIWIGSAQPAGYYFLFKMSAYGCLGQNYQFNLGPLV